MAPLPSATMVITAATPMIMPSVVSIVRMRLRRSAVTAIRNVVNTDISGNTPPEQDPFNNLNNLTPNGLGGAMQTSQRLSSSYCRKRRRYTVAMRSPAGAAFAGLRRDGGPRMSPAAAGISARAQGVR
jgi:hypothetical protein